MIADLARYWHWSPQDAWELTGSELVWWLDQANRIVRREQTPAEE